MVALYLGYIATCICMRRDMDAALLVNCDIIVIYVKQYHLYIIYSHIYTRVSYNPFVTLVTLTTRASFI